ncbi:MAG TPA: hypothetical protein VKT80_16135, partial [Chloroflexota bacterium]|nr:hypothetical protein [Chloroflexota bacterium]
MLTVARLLNGETPAFESYEDRLREIGYDSEALTIRRRELMDERQKAIDGIVFEEGNSMLPELKKKYEQAQARLKRVLQDIEDLKRIEAELQGRTQRFLNLRTELTALSGVRVAVCPLTWESGHPLDGTSALSRYFDERFSIPNPKAKSFATKVPTGVLWVQAAGDTRGQTWTGLFRDDDGNGVLEFAPLAQPLKKDRWTPELNFLAWQPFDGVTSAELPEQARIRVTIQWREPHDSSLSDEADDPYREPLANLGLIVLRQRDPTGTKLGTDDLDVVARSTANAVRLRKQPASGTYEDSVDFTVVSGARFAIRVEGRIPDTTRPAASPTLPVQRRQSEIRPRILVEVLDPATQAKGRVVFADYAGTVEWPAPSVHAPAEFGGVGMPGDARNVLTVGAANASGRSAFASSVGAGPGREMMVKPDVLGFAVIDLGTPRKVGG